jgi:cell division initiation protein
MDVTPQSIRAVQFREKLRGYHPDDVDAFVASVAKAMEDLEHRLRVAESTALELESRHSATGDAEESLRRTLVLAQRTADLAIQEARDEAARVLAESAEQRAAVEAEVEELRARLRSEAEDEGRGERERLVAERAALLTDVETLRAHVERERERLRIYFTDQLRRVEEGEPAVEPAPEMQAPDDAPEVDAAGEARDRDDRDELDDLDRDDDRDRDDRDDLDDDRGPRDEVEEDPFLAELRRAVTDERPLGPRDDEPPTADRDDEGDDGFDLFAKGEDDPGRFGSRLRRRR